MFQSCELKRFWNEISKISPAFVNKFKTFDVIAFPKQETQKKQY